jgi:cellulose biosynthesis protein BcsQ
MCSVSFVKQKRTPYDTTIGDWSLRAAPEHHANTEERTACIQRLSPDQSPSTRSLTRLRFIHRDWAGSTRVPFGQRGRRASRVRLWEGRSSFLFRYARCNRARIDTPPNNSVSVIEAIEAATLVIIPCRPGLFDVDAVQETIALARQARTPYAVVFNAAPPKREEIESLAVSLARRCLAQLEVPVWGGQISHRASFSLALTEGEGVKGYDSDPCSTAEIRGLWSAIEKSVKVIHGAREKAAMHRVAA